MGKLDFIRVPLPAAKMMTAILGRGIELNVTPPFAFTSQGKTATTEVTILLLVNTVESMSVKHAIIFDLDGTLVDTAPDLTDALNATMSALDLPEVDEASVRHMVGRGARVLIERGLSAAGVKADKALVDQAMAIFLSHYSDHIADRSQPFDGVIETLNHFRQLETPMGVCTNKPQALTIKLLEILELIDYFPVILGADKVRNRKPHPDHLLETISGLKIAPKNAIMIGDSTADVEAARAAGVPIIAVSFGYSYVAPHDLGADLVIDDFTLLPDAIRGFS